MRVRARLFATLSRYYANARPGVSFDIEVPEGTTVGDLITRLNLPSEEVKVVFVNGRARPNHWPLQAGDEIGIFPPIGGG